MLADVDHMIACKQREFLLVINTQEIIICPCSSSSAVQEGNQHLFSFSISPLYHCFSVTGLILMIRIVFIYLLTIWMLCMPIICSYNSLSQACLWTFMTILSDAHLWGLMLIEKVWLIISIVIHPKPALYFWGQDSVRSVKFFHNKQTHLSLYESCFVHSCLVMLEHEGSIPKLFTQSWVKEIVWNVWLCWSINGSFKLN